MATPRKTWQEKATATAIQKKMTRKKNPVSSLVQLAEEFGAPISGPYSGSGRSTSPSFRNHVKTVMGTRMYSAIRDRSQVRS